MVFLSIICGTLSVILGFVSVLNDYKIRSLSRFHPFIHRFINRNALAILAGVTASLSGILALIGYVKITVLDWHITVVKAYFRRIIFIAI